MKTTSPSHLTCTFDLYGEYPYEPFLLCMEKVVIAKSAKVEGRSNKLHVA